MCELGGQRCLQGLVRLEVHQDLELVPAVGILHPGLPAARPMEGWYPQEVGIYALNHKVVLFLKKTFLLL